MLGVRLPYHPVLWLPLGVLHLSLLVRVAGGALDAGVGRVGPAAWAPAPTPAGGTR